MRFLNRLPEYVLAIQQCAEPRISIAFLVASCLDTCALQQILVGFLQHTEFVCIAFQDDCIVSRMKNSAKMRKIISNLKTFPRCARPFSQAIHKKMSYIELYIANVSTLRARPLSSDGKMRGTIWRIVPIFKLEN